VLSREQLLDLAFSNDAEVFDRAVDVQVSRLRRKLERPGQSEIIRTVRGEGYLFTVKPSP
jgi:two-component system OmpR family response regulator